MKTASSQSAQKANPSFRLIQYGILVAVVAIAVVFYPSQCSVSVANVDEVPNTDWRSLQRYNVIAQVPRAKWNYSDPKFAMTLFQAGKPFIFTDAPVQKWPATQKWSPQYMIDTSGELRFDFKTQLGDPVFVYASEPGGLERLPELKKSSKKHIKPTWMSVKQFWNHVLNDDGDLDTAKDDQPYYYFLGSVQQAGTAGSEFKKMVKDVNPINFFAVDDKYFMNIWFGSRGVVAQTHYDFDINFATQIHGHKRWILSPPSEAGKLYLFPQLHSQFRQSQVNFKNGEPIDTHDRKWDAPDKFDALFPLFNTKVTGYEAVVGPGEVLFLPPFWFHRVVTEDASIMVNTWTQIPPGDPYKAVHKLPVPFESNWTEEQNSVAVRFQIRTYLWEIYSLMDPIDTPEYARSSFDAENDVWAFFLVREQYRALMRDSDLVKLSFDCYAESENGEFVDTLLAKIRDGGYATTLVDHLKRLNDPHAAHLILSTYVDGLVEIVFGPRTVWPFLRSCLKKHP